MKGEIIDVDWSFHSGVTSGVVAGVDGNVYKFGRTEWCESYRPQVGMPVDFVAHDECVSEVKHFDYRSSSEHEHMQGFVLDSDKQSSEGVISGNDGKRYRVARLDWRNSDVLEMGRKVDFIADGDRARDVCGIATRPGSLPKSKVTAAILAFFFGLFGVHKFYLGFTGQGIIMLLSTIAGFVLTAVLVGYLVLLAVAVISFVEFITYLSRSDQDFYETYFVKKQRWF